MPKRSLAAVFLMEVRERERNFVNYGLRVSRLAFPLMSRERVAGEKDGGFSRSASDIPESGLRRPHTPEDMSSPPATQDKVASAVLRLDILTDGQ